MIFSDVMRLLMLSEMQRSDLAPYHDGSSLSYLQLFLAGTLCKFGGAPGNNVNPDNMVISRTSIETDPIPIYCLD